MAVRRYRARRGLAIVLGLIGAAVYVGGAIVAWRSPELTVAVALSYVAAAIVWAPWSIIGVVIAARGVRTQGSTMLAVAIAGSGFNNSLENIPLLLGHKPAWQFPVDLVSAFLAAGAYLRPAQLFPRALTEADVLSRRAAWPWLPGFQRALAAVLRPWAAWAIVLLWLITTVLAERILQVATASVILLGAAFWRVHVRVGNSAVRSRVTWILQSVLVFAMMYIVSSALMALLKAGGVGIEARSWVFIVYSIVLAIGGCGSMAMAVFGAGAFNPSLAVRSTVVYGAAISLLLFALNVIASVLVDTAADAFGLSDRLVAATLGAIAGLLLEPVAKGLRRLLERAAPRLTEEPD